MFSKGKKYLFASLMTTASIASTGCGGVDGATLGSLAGMVPGYSSVFGAELLGPEASLVAMYVAPIIGAAADHIQITNIKQSESTGQYAVYAQVDGKEYECIMANLVSTSSTDTCTVISSPESNT